ncbi:hypothetical protein CPLU01_01427 [Colletotrichum plurivorum]|uniref:Uncharacterized protein n=1 Tax=Colletotrichum plurivorum TaxID=2175906 RepID=A0A8H6NPE6_9PEZI|nr:hypothetical protein CPLU01_01427 [Colletotrichum plurivorum]
MPAVRRTTAQDPRTQTTHPGMASMPAVVRNSRLGDQSERFEGPETDALMRDALALLVCVSPSAQRSSRKEWTRVKREGEIETGNDGKAKRKRN